MTAAKYGFHGVYSGMVHFSLKYKSVLGECGMVIVSSYPESRLLDLGGLERSVTIHSGRFRDVGSGKFEDGTWFNVFFLRCCLVNSPAFKEISKLLEKEGDSAFKDSEWASISDVDSSSDRLLGSGSSLKLGIVSFEVVWGRFWEDVESFSTKRSSEEQDSDPVAAWGRVWRIRVSASAPTWWNKEDAWDRSGTLMLRLKLRSPRDNTDITVAMYWRWFSRSSLTSTCRLHQEERRWFPRGERIIARCRARWRLQSSHWDTSSSELLTLGLRPVCSASRSSCALGWRCTEEEEWWCETGSCWTSNLPSEKYIRHHQCHSSCINEN